MRIRKSLILIIGCFVFSHSIVAQTKIPEPKTDTYSLNGFNPSGNGFILTNLQFSSKVFLDQPQRDKLAWNATISFKSCTVEGYLYNGATYSKSQLINDFGLTESHFQSVTLESVNVTFNNGKSFKANFLGLRFFDKSTLAYSKGDENTDFNIRAISIVTASGLGIDAKIKRGLEKKAQNKIREAASEEKEEATNVNKSENEMDGISLNTSSRSEQNPNSSSSEVKTSKEESSSKTQNTTKVAGTETKEKSDYDYEQANRNRKAQADADRQEAIDEAAYAVALAGNVLVNAINRSRVFLTLSTGVQIFNNSNALRINGNLEVPEIGVGYKDINISIGAKLYWGPVYWNTEIGLGSHIYSGWIVDSEEFFTDRYNTPALRNWKPYLEGSEKDMFYANRFVPNDDMTIYRRYLHDENVTFYNVFIKTGLGLAVPISNRVEIDAEVNIGLISNPLFMNKQLSESLLLWVLPEYRLIVHVGRIGFGIGLANPLYFADPDRTGEMSYLMEDDGRLSRTQANDGKYYFNGRVEFNDAEGNPEKRINYSMLWSLTLVWTLANDKQ